MNNNFGWIVDDIRESIVLRIAVNGEYKLFKVDLLLEVTGDKIEVESANIDDLSNLLMFGIVRFVDINNNSNIMDIPFRNVIKLYQNGNMVGCDERRINIIELDAFSVIDGCKIKEIEIVPLLLGDVSMDLYQLMEEAFKFLYYGMQEKIDSMKKITIINYRRLMNDKIKDKIM